MIRFKIYKIIIFLLLTAFLSPQQKSDSTKVQKKQAKIIITKLDSIILKLDSIKIVKDLLKRRK